VGLGSSPAEKLSFYRTLGDALSLASSLFRGRAIFLGGSIGSATTLAEQNSFIRSLQGSLSPASGASERMLLFRSLGVSLTAASRAVRGSFYTETPSTNFGTRTVLSGDYNCHENITSNCGIQSGFFAFLVIAAGLLVFGIYAGKQRWQSRARPEKPEPEIVSVDEEGWETKQSQANEDAWKTKDSTDDDGWEAKLTG